MSRLKEAICNDVSRLMHHSVTAQRGSNRLRIDSFAGISDGGFKKLNVAFVRHEPLRKKSLKHQKRRRRVIPTDRIGVAFKGHSNP